MSDEGEHIVVEQHSNAGKWILIGLAVAFVAASAYGHFTMHARMEKMSKDLGASQAQVAELQNRMQNAEASEEAIGQRLGMTKKELATRTAQLRSEQKAAEIRLENEQKARISEVTGDIAGVKTDVGGVKTDVASTRADLEATKAKLQTTIGDLGMQSGLVAHTRDDLEILKHKGDRNYYEFTLSKSKHATPVGTVSLQLKKVDAKKGKFTMNVIADDRTIEKKDRNVAEPLQFYTGRDRMLYEVVVFSAAKDSISGYLSTPKNAPQPGVIAQ